MREEVEEIKRRVDLVALVGQSVKLARRGKAYQGLCPFHTEKSPSFYVYPAGRSGAFFKCFGCNESGDAFSFVMKVQQLDFPNAKKFLADSVGIQLRAVDPKREAKRARLFAAMEVALRYFTTTLAATPDIVDYARGRGFTDENIQHFELGYLPDGGGVTKALQDGGVLAQDAIDAGILGRSERGSVYERLRGRLIFPVRDDNGKLVTFSGRLVKPDPEKKEPKYMNGPATDIFDKSSVLYGLYHARRSTGPHSLSVSRTAVLVEGYMDVAICHQGGFPNVVAPMGTAITELHVRKLHRLVDNIILALDPDAAGQGGATRGVETIQRTLIDMLGTEERLGVTVRVLDLPEGKDPDELILDDPLRWETAVKGAPTVLDRAFSKHNRLDREDPKAKRVALDEIAPFLVALSDPLAIKHYRDKLKNLLEVDDELLNKLLRTDLEKRQNIARSTPSTITPVSTSPGSVELRVLHALLAYPDVYAQLVADWNIPQLDTESVLTPPARAVLPLALNHNTRLNDLAVALEALPEEHADALAAIYATELPKSERAFGELVFALHRAALRRAKDVITSQMDAALAKNDLPQAEEADVQLRARIEDLRNLDATLAAFAERVDRAL